MSNIERQIRRNAARAGRTVARKQAKRESILKQIGGFFRLRRAKKERDKARAAAKEARHAR